MIRLFKHLSKRVKKVDVARKVRKDSIKCVLLFLPSPEGVIAYMYVCNIHQKPPKSKLTSYIKKLLITTSAELSIYV